MVRSNDNPTFNELVRERLLHPLSVVQTAIRTSFSLRSAVFSADRVQERAEAPRPRAGGDCEEQEGFCRCYKRGSGRESSGPGEVVSSGLLCCLNMKVKVHRMIW